jgi:hypothetical protein
MTCHACGQKFTVTRNTVLYRLKSSASVVEKTVWLLALGVDVPGLLEVYQVREMTIRTWLCRSGMYSQRLLHLQFELLSKILIKRYRHLLAHMPR